MQHVLIVEADEIQLKFLVHIISSQYPDWVIEVCRNYDLGIKSIVASSIDNSSPYTLFILDSCYSNNTLENHNKFFLLESIRCISMYSNTPILFLSREYSDMSYDLSVFSCYDYIDKPFTSERILEKFKKLNVINKHENFITIADTNRVIHKINIEDIIFVQSKKHLKILHITDNITIQTREYSFDDLISITSNTLIYCHKTYIINPNYITSYDKVTSSIKIKEISIPVGRKYKNNIALLFQ